MKLDQIPLIQSYRVKFAHMRISCKQIKSYMVAFLESKILSEQILAFVILVVLQSPIFSVKVSYPLDYRVVLSWTLTKIHMCRS